jgi:hypothetical protein
MARPRIEAGAGCAANVTCGGEMARTDPLGGVAETEFVDMNCNHRVQAYATRQKRPLSTNIRIAGPGHAGAGVV